MDAKFHLSCLNLIKFYKDYKNSLSAIQKAESDNIDIINCSLSSIPLLETKLQEAENYRCLVMSISDTVMDMIWAKDLDGRYIYANQRIKDDLLFDQSPLGKTDIQMATARKLIVGEENHDFGRVCGNSDLKVLESGKPEKFLEYGTISKQDGTVYVMYLEVYKTLLVKNGKVVGICGVGRDVTVHYTAILNAATELVKEFDCENSDGYKNVIKALDQFKFESNQHAICKNKR